MTSSRAWLSSLPIAGLLCAAFASAQEPAAVTTLPELLTPPEVELGDEPVNGTVALRLEIDEEGLVRRVDVVSGLSPAVDWAALGAATRLRFTPAVVNGAPVAAVIDYQLDFSSDVVTPPSSFDEERAPEIAGPPATLRGRIRVAGGALPLAQAEVAVVFEATEEVSLSYTDGEGRFAVTDLSPGAYRVEVTAFGYEPVTVSQVLEGGQDVELRVSLKSDVGDPFETVIRAGRGGAAVSRVTLTRDEVSAIPGTFGDPLRVIDSLPGAARTPLFGGGLVLRGGMPGDSRIFLDGVEIPVLFHWGGLASIFNATFLEEISYYPSGFPVEFGRATAGVVDVKSHALDLEGFVGHVDIDATDTGFFFGGPVRIGELPKLTFGFAARRSYLEGLGSLVLGAATVFAIPLPFLPVPRYFDFQAKVQTRPLPGHRLAVTAFGSDDRFGLLGEPLDLELPGDLSFEELLNSVVANELFRVILEHEWRVAPGVTHVLRPWAGTTKRGALADNLVVNLFSGGAFATPERQLNWGVRDELRLTFRPWLSVTTGVEHVGKTFTLGLGEPFADPEQECPPDLPPDQLCIEAYLAKGHELSTALYARLELGPLDGVSLYPGVRVERFWLQYEDEYEHLAVGRVTAQDLVAVDPRLSARWQMVRSFAAKGSFGLYQMAPTISESVLDDDGSVLRLERALHATVGFEHDLTPDVFLDVQLYGVERAQLVRNGRKLWTPERGRAPLIPIAIPGPYDSLGRGQTVGVELMLRHQPNRWFFGWVAYTFAHTWLDVGDELDPYHPSPFDQTHNLVLVGRVNLPWELTLGGRFQYATGNPSPIPGTIAVVHDLSQSGGFSYRAIEDPGRRPRLPDFHRLDVRLDKKLTFEGFTVGGYVEVMNVYNRLNAEVIAPGGDFRSRGNITVLPSVPFLPSVGLSGSF